MNTDLLKGYTPFSNKILFEVCRSDLSGAEFRVLLTILRYTSGYHRNSHELSISFIAESTGLRTRTVERMLARLRQKRFIITSNSKNQTNIISLMDGSIGFTSDETVGTTSDEMVGITSDEMVGTPPTKRSVLPPTKWSDKKNIERYIKDSVCTPTLDDVISYCRQMSFTFSPERFFDYYEAIGWQKNGQPIMNWKAVARNWQARERTQPAQEEVKKDDWGRPIPPEFV